MSSSMDTDSFQSSPDFTNNNNNISPRKYALSGRIMLTAIIILFFIVILMIILHLYARWYLLRVRRRRRHHHLRRRTPHLVFYMDPSMHATTTAAAAAAAISTTTAHGLDPDVLKRLPVFTCKENSEHVLECAVCLSEFKENEAGRLLPKCGHVFHTECIDMWFHSHSTCPLCRDVVELVEGVGQDDGPSSSRSVEGIKVEDGFRSSLSRVLSFGRILSRDGRRSVSCGGDTAVEEEVVVVVDVEVGREARESRADWGRMESSRRSSG